MATGKKRVNWEGYIKERFRKLMGGKSPPQKVILIIFLKTQQQKTALCSNCHYNKNTNCHPIYDKECLKDQKFLDCNLLLIIKILKARGFKVLNYKLLPIL